MADDKLTHAEDTARRIEVVMLPIYSAANATYDGAMVPRDKVYDDLQEIVKWLRAGWQPIDTAPTDGTLFLAYAEAGQHGLPAMYSLCSWHLDGGFCIDELRAATHWMPLPTPPEVRP